MGGLLNFITGNGGKKEAEQAAAAQIESANKVALNDRIVAKGAEQARETMIAQDVASRAAADRLSVPQDKIDVSLATATPIDMDPATGRRRTTRSTFTSKTPTSGIRL